MIKPREIFLKELIYTAWQHNLMVFLFDHPVQTSYPAKDSFSVRIEHSDGEGITFDVVITPYNDVYVARAEQTTPRYWDVAVITTSHWQPDLESLCGSMVGQVRKYLEEEVYPEGYYTW